MGLDGVAEPVEQKGHPVQGDAGLPRARHALDNQHLGLFVADNLVLLLLDGGDDGLHLLIGGVGQLLLEDVVLDVLGAVEGVLNFPVYDFELAL